MDTGNQLLAIVLALGFVIFGACQSNEGEEARNSGNSSAAKEEPMNQDGSKKRLSPPDTAKIALGDWMMEVSYGSPSVRDREIWGDLVPYDKVWRTGANEATIFSTNRPVIIFGNSLEAGKYALFTIPGMETWTVIFNKVWNQWGAYEYNENEDALRVVVKPEQINTITEQLTFDFEKVDDHSVKLNFLWETLQFSVPIKKAE